MSLALNRGAEPKAAQRRTGFLGTSPLSTDPLCSYPRASGQSTSGRNSCIASENKSKEACKHVSLQNPPEQSGQGPDGSGGMDVVPALTVPTHGIAPVPWLGTARGQD